MLRFQPYITLSLALSCSACNQEAAVPVAIGHDEIAPAPLEITFKPLSASFTLNAEREGEPSGGPPPGRDQVYDPKTGIFHIHFKSKNMKRSAFEITKAADHFRKSVVFRFTGATRGDGCLGQDLTFSVDGKDYALSEGALSYGHVVDTKLFRIANDVDAVTVEFTKQGERLLKPGAQVWLRFDTGW